MSRNYTLFDMADAVAVRTDPVYESNMADFQSNMADGETMFGPTNRRVEEPETNQFLQYTSAVTDVNKYQEQITQDSESFPVFSLPPPTDRKPVPESSLARPAVHNKDVNKEQPRQTAINKVVNSFYFNVKY